MTELVADGFDDVLLDVQVVPELQRFAPLGLELLMHGDGLVALDVQELRLVFDILLCLVYQSLLRSQL